MRTVNIVQARMASTRFPGKVMEPVMGRPLLAYLVERLKRCKTVEDIVIATTMNPLDQQIIDFCKQEKIAYYRGSEADVLDRYWQAAKANGADVVVRITADCPLIDPLIIDNAVALFLKEHPSYDYLSNTLSRTYPRGMDVEVFTFESLESAKIYGAGSEEREHVTPYIYRHPDRFSLGAITRKPNSSHYRLTVDTVEDFSLVSKLLQTLYPTNPHFGLGDLLRLLEQNPEWAKINAAIEQKNIG